MKNVKNSQLWKKSFHDAGTEEHRHLVDQIEQVFAQVRERASTLTAEIAVILPHYTVHDISHLDALWEVGSQITGDSVKLNPIEGFILGCAFLIHDAAMTTAAYPGGIEEIKGTKAWNKILSRIEAKLDAPKESIESVALELFLREQHASRAGELPFVTWKSQYGQSALIENMEYRQKYGSFIGMIAASHWWSYDKLEYEMRDKIIPAPPPFPSNWSIDLLKIACILRTADAAQIDERRAPGFLLALREGRLSNLSKTHWSFQNKLAQAQCRGDALFFASTDSFDRAEAKNWWTLYDTLKMVDDELRKTDDLLARSRPDNVRFAARRVANIDSPSALTSSIPTRGWKPLDTSFSISDIPKLIENLGGGQLYGNHPFIAIREVVQNAMDATRLRGLLDASAPAPQIEVKLDFSREVPSLSVKDNGIGMSTHEITNNLLSFGASGWLEDRAIGEYTDIFPNNRAVSGRYGIGFF